MWFWRKKVQNRLRSQRIEAFAPAKINLTLHVTGLRADGYHRLDSLVAFADVGDRLWLEAGPRLSIEISGPFADGVPADDGNLVWRAAELAGWSGHIHLQKNLPHGGGVGGGSSDAAAVLRALGSEDAGLSLGADVPVCKLGQSARMRGIGDEVTPVTLPIPIHAVLVNPMRHVPTPAIFKALREKDNAEMPEMPTEPDAFWAWLALQRNDLQAPALALEPMIGEALEALSGHGARLVRMSGSGSTCFALFADAETAKVAAEALKSTCPDWWVFSASL